MTTFGTVFYGGMLFVTLVMVILAVLAELWLYALAAAALGACFAYAAPFILGRRWRRPPPRPTRRPVVRRRR